MSSSDSTCIVCFKTVDIYSIGVCDHPVCYECSTRMRILCRQNECPICRQDLPKVIFTKTVRPFKMISKNNYPIDKEFNIMFDGRSAQSSYEKLLKHECNVCDDSKNFQLFQLLKDHMRKKHELYYCDLCVDNLKIFSHERRVYTRQELAHHRRKGDVDDKSHKGHPLCEFCDERYMDNDELFRHLRKDHLFCHFCDSDGLHQFYRSYNDLRKHFKEEHYLCEEGTCFEEQFTPAFRSEIDLKAHKANSHSRTMGKQAAKQARTLEVEFTLAPRRERMERTFRSSDRPFRRPVSPVSLSCNHAGACNCNRESMVAKTDQTVRPEPHSTDEHHLNPSDFPTLGTVSSIPPMAHSAGSKGPSGAFTIRAGGPALSITDENFPALSNSSSTPSQVWRFSVNSRGPQDRPSSAPTNLSIQVNRKQPTISKPQNGMQTLSNRPMRMRAAPVSCSNPLAALEEANFPALKPLDSYRGTSAEQWATSQAVDAGHSQVRSKVSLISPAEAAQIMGNKPPVHSGPKKAQFVKEEDFPSLAPCSTSSGQHSLKHSTKKASSVTIPMSHSWSHQVRDDSPEKSSDSEINSAGNAKSKKKKKKAKNINASESEGMLSEKKTVPEQTHAFPSADNSKKKKKQRQQQPPNQEGLKEQPKSQFTKADSNGNSQSRDNVANQENQDPVPDGQLSNSTRKRSELQIERLQITDNQSNPEDPTSRLLSILRGDNHEPKSSGSIVNPPPGFERPPELVNGAKMTPPPGFSVKVNSIVRPSCNQLTFTNSSGESYPILSTYNFNQFVQPPDFQRRNAALMARVVEVLKDPMRQEEFRQKSILFRQGQLTSESYFKHCVELMGEKAFNECFPEMLVLLPEIDRQQALLKVYRQFNNDQAVKLRFELCATCGQVLKPSDLRVHVSTHSLENHFPSLSTVDSIQSSAWHKK